MGRYTVAACPFGGLSRVAFPGLSSALRGAYRGR